MNSNYGNIVNLLCNQVLWLICIIGGDYWAIVCGFAYCWFYCYFIGNIRMEWQSIVLVALMGFCTDILLSLTGIIHFESTLAFPAWLFVLWLSFASLLHHGLQWLQSKLFLSILSGAILGPLSYYAGAELGDSFIKAPILVFTLTYGIIWAIFMPLFLTLAKTATTGIKP